MVSTKPQPAAATEDFLTNCTVHFPRIPFGMLFGKSNADLHRPTGAHRIKRTKQRLPHWYHADQIVKNRAQLLFCTHRI
ncbi:Uncharacterised protein [Shigella sonnei]|nr:Uncharacterised protein [Shigella sonnei]CSF79777.1 Uncharacterised protein [Shigella sonnei]CSP74215.1 Uncharacterised protein [Shigella sonnei]CSS03519.1 Uncharacterised protein [Shigella sonnei]